MEKKHFQKIISSLIILSIFFGVPYFSFTKKTEAAGISSYINQLGSAVTQLPLCQSAITSGIKNLFSSGDNIASNLSSNGSGYSSSASSASSSLSSSSPTASDGGNTMDSTDGFTDDSASSAESGSGVSSVTTYDPQNAALQKQNQNKLNQISKTVSATNTNDTCLQSIGRMIIKTLLQKITVSTVKWINSGFNGSPAFVQDPKGFFTVIAKNEILQFSSEINNPNLFPFGKDFIQNTTNQFNSGFANDAQYTLNKVQGTPSGYSAQTFNNDFSSGGWSAWDALTQNPANNPLGFDLIAANELENRLTGPNSVATLTNNTLTQSGGYLGQQQCSLPADIAGITKQENDARIKANASLTTGPKQEVCTTWQTITPGQMVAQAATKAINYPDNNLLKAQDLNDAISAILDALLNNFSSTLQTKGFTGLSDSTEQKGGADGTFISNNSVNFQDSQTQQDYSTSVLSASTWLAQNPDFNIRTDLNQALVDEQRTYADKLTEQDNVLESDVTTTTNPDGTITTLGKGLLPTIYQLDYCIPGPHPGWESDTQTNLQNAESEIVDTSGMDFTQVATATGHTDNVGMELTMIAKELGVADTDTIDMVAKMLGTGTAHCGAGASVTDCVNRYYFHDVIEDFTHLDLYDHDDNFQTYTKTINILNRIYNDYVDAIHNTYISEIMPTVTDEATTEFNKAAGYEQQLKANEAKIPAVNSLVSRLTAIKAGVDTLNKVLAEGKFLGPDGNPIADQQGEYETELKPWLDSFGRLSAEMVSGDDIAAVSTLTKQMEDERDYVKTSLLQGSQGCENDLSRLPPQLSLSNINRPNYPFPILYQYPTVTYSALNSEPIVGFLPFAAYSGIPESSWSHSNEYDFAMNFCKFYTQYNKTTDADCGNQKGPDYLYITDLLTVGDNGMYQTGFLWGQGKGEIVVPFEEKMGIY